jgi:Ca2+-binding RTX toxin-like protein
VYAISALSTKTVLADSKGTDRLDFSGAATGITLDLAKSAGQLQRVFGSASATMLALKGVFENAVGTPQADVIRGNSVANDIRGGAGNDTIYGGAGSDVLSGEDGDDWLYGEAGDDRLFGGPGNNVLLGGDGKDLLDVAGSSGRNLLIGGKGADSLTGGAGQDILIGGTTSHDANARALAATIERWASGADDTFADRCSLLESGVPLGKKRIALKANSTVLNDRTADTLFGGAGRDWFFAFKDDASDRTSPEDR